MSELKKATDFSAAQFQALQSDLTAKAQLAESQLKQASQFTTTDFIPAEIAPAVSPKPAKRGLWLWGSALLSLGAVAALQWGLFIQQSWQNGWWQGALVSLLTGLATVLAVRFGVREWRIWRQLAKRQSWRQDSNRLQQSMQFGEAYPMCQQMARAMQTSQTQTQWQQFEQQRKAEFSDAELLQLFELTVLQPVDIRVEQQIRQASLQTGVAVALSPFALADMLLVIWRGSLMLREIALLYGTPVGKVRSLALIRQFIKTVFFTGAAEMAVDVGADLLGAELSGKLSARLGQGVLAGVMVARLGRFAQQQLRPLAMPPNEQSLVKLVVSDLVKKLNPLSGAK